MGIATGDDVFVRGAGLRGMETILYSFFLIFSAFSWLLPNHYFPWLSAYQEFSSFFSLIVLLAIMTLRGVVKVQAGFLIFISLVFFPLLQGCLGIIYFGGDVFISMVYVSGFSFMMLFSYNLALSSSGRVNFVTMLACLFLFSAVVSVWIALYQWLRLPFTIWVAVLAEGGRPFANFAQPNNLATFLCMGLSGLIYLYEKSFLGRLACSFLGFFLIFGLALTQSRTPWVSSFLFVCFWFWKGNSIGFRIGRFWAAFWLVVYGFFVFLVPFIGEGIFLGGVGLAQRAQSLERVGIYGHFWHAAWNGPFWGYGWNQAGVAQVLNTLDYPLKIMTSYAHNFVLDLLVWNGLLPGLIFASIFLGWLMNMAIRVCTVEGVFSLLVVGFILVHGMLEFPLSYAFFLLPFALVVGVLQADLNVKHFFCVGRGVLFGILICAVGLFLLVWRDYRLIEADYQLMRFEKLRIHGFKSVDAAPDVFVLTQWREYLRFSRTDAHPQMSAAEIEWMRKVSYRHPYAPSLSTYALALGLNGNPEEAASLLKILKGLHGDYSYEQALARVRGLELRYPQLGEVLDALRVRVGSGKN